MTSKPWVGEAARIRALLALVLFVALGVRVWMALRHPRFFDDHYVFINITRFLDGWLTPRHSYYGTLSYLPQALFLALLDRLHAWTGIESLAVRGTAIEGFTLGAYRAMRLFVVAYAVLSLAVIYLIGRRLFSPWVGLVAAAVLAAYPQHVRSSIQLKPDMLALLLTLVTLYWTVRAVEDPRLVRFLVAGVGVGLATSAKYYGAAAALPLTVWAIVSGFRDRRRWLWLLLAGLASLATFAVLNPFLRMVVSNGQGLVHLYATRAKSLDSDHGLVLRRELEFLADQHGWLLPFLLAGTILLALRLRGGTESARSAALLPLSLLVGYTALHAACLTLFYSHNFMLVLGGAALVCAYGLAVGVPWLLVPLSRLSPNARPKALLAATLLVGGLLLASPFAFAYGRLVPDTWAEAGIRVGARLRASRSWHLAYEPADAHLASPADGERTARTAVASLAGVPQDELDLTDAEVFPLARTEGATAAFYQGRRARLPAECALEIHALPFRYRGSPLLVLVHPWGPAGSPWNLELRRSGETPELVARFPADLAEGDAVTLELIRPQAVPVQQLTFGSARTILPLRTAWERRKKVKLLTERFRFAAGTSEVRLAVPANAHPENFRLRLWRWKPRPCR